MTPFLCLLAAQGLHEEDFENRRALDVVYDRWERVRSPGHPAYNAAAVEPDPSAPSGRHVLRLETRGGAVALRLGHAAAWAVDPAFPWRLRVFARARGAVRNRAFAAIEWLDARRELLREDVSDPAPNADAWREITLDVLHPPVGAAFAAVRLEYAGGDVRGECRFDALRLEAVARLELEPKGRAAAIFEPGAPIRFDVLARGLPPGESRLLLRSEAATVGPFALRPDRPALIELPAHAPGVYTLRAEVSGSAARAEIPLLVPNAWIFRPRGPRWIGMSINPFARELPDAAALAQLAGAERVRVTLSDRPPAGRRDPDPGRLAELVRVLAMPEKARVTGALARPSPALFPGRDVDVLGQVFTLARRDAWDAPLRALAARHAGAIAAWEVGDVHLGPDLEPLGASPKGELLPAPGEDLAAWTRGVIERAAAADRPEAPFVALEAFVDAQGRPTAALAALRALNDVLSGAKVLRDSPQLLNAREIAFEKEGFTILAAWAPAETEREAHLGEGTIVYPPLGTARPHRPGERLKLGPLPLFIVKRDDVVLESPAGLRFLPDSTLPLRVDPPARTLSFRNLSPDETLTDVRVRLLEPLPPGWRPRPLEMRAASLAPGEELAQDVLFHIPPDAQEGSVDLRLELAFRKAGGERRARVTRTLELRSAIGIELSARPAGENERTVVVSFTNKSARPLSFVARARLPGLPERVETVGPLEPDERREVRYLVKDVQLLDPTRPLAEVLCEERGGERARARAVLSGVR